MLGPTQFGQIGLHHPTVPEHVTLKSNIASPSSALSQQARNIEAPGTDELSFEAFARYDGLLQ